MPQCGALHLAGPRRVGVFWCLLVVSLLNWVALYYSCLCPFHRHSCTRKYGVPMHIHGAMGAFQLVAFGVATQWWTGCTGAGGGALLLNLPSVAHCRCSCLCAFRHRLCSRL